MSLKCSDLIRQYDGTGDFLEWVQKLELVAQLQKIKDLHQFLPLFLSGGAFSVYQSISQADKDDYDLVKRSLTSAFSMGPFKAYEVFVARHLSVGESVDVYLADLSRVASLVSTKVDEDWIKCAFVCGLPEDIKSQMLASCSLAPMALHDVVEKARGLVSTRDTCFAGVVENSRRNGLRPTQCYRCNGFGHVARECATADGADKIKGAGAYGRRNGGGDRHCYVCGKVGHMASTCSARKIEPSKNE